MSQYDYAKRIKRMISREYKLTRREAKLAKESCEYYNNLHKLQDIYRKQDKEFEECRTYMQKLQQNNADLSQQLDAAESQLQAAVQNVNQLQEQARQQLAEEAEMRQQVLAEMDRLRCLKVATNTYVNLKVLPERFQGITLHEEEHRSQWRPFCIEQPLKVEPEKLQQLVWNNAPESADYREAWEKIFFNKMR